MTGLSTSPRVLKGGLVVMDPDSGRVGRLIPLQYNPETLTRSLQPQGPDGEGNRSEALRLRGPAIETIKLEAEIDATDFLEKPDTYREAGTIGIHATLAAIELLLQPTSASLVANGVLASLGTIEIVPTETPLVLFVWSRHRILPVRVTEYAVIEEAFDPALNPIRARISLSLRVLSVDDLGFSHKGGSLYLGYLQAREQLARRMPRADLGQLGLGSIP